SVEFLTVHHAIVQALRHLALLNLGMRGHACTAIGVAVPAARPGQYAFYLYELQTFGLTRAIRVVPVAVHLATREVSEGVGQAVLAAFSGQPPKEQRASFSSAIRCRGGASR